MLSQSTKYIQAFPHFFPTAQELVLQQNQHPSDANIIKQGCLQIFFAVALHFTTFPALALFGAYIPFIQYCTGISAIVLFVNHLYLHLQSCACCIHLALLPKCLDYLEALLHKSLALHIHPDLFN